MYYALNAGHTVTEIANQIRLRTDTVGQWRLFMIKKEMASVVRISDSTNRVEYNPMELEITKDNIAKEFGRCEFGEIIYVKVEGELKLEIYWDSQVREYKNVQDRY